jgi:hypothetical protein
MGKVGATEWNMAGRDGFRGRREGEGDVEMACRWVGKNENCVRARLGCDSSEMGTVWLVGRPWRSHGALLYSAAYRAGEERAVSRNACAD